MGEGEGEGRGVVLETQQKARLASLEELKREAKVGIQQVEFGKTAAKLFLSFRGCN